MHTQGFGRVLISLMQIFEENTRRVGGIDVLKKLYMYDYEALEEFPFGICTLKALEELYFHRYKYVTENTGRVGGIGLFKDIIYVGLRDPR